MSDSRERFESVAVTSKWLHPHELLEKVGDDYVYPNVQSLWLAYQSAEAQAVRACVEIIEHPGLCLVEARRHIRAAFPHAFKE